MSLKINLSLTTQRFIVTVTEKVTLENPSFVMVLSSDFTNKTYTIELGENISTSKNRYDEFLVSYVGIPVLERGRYVYRIYEYIDTFDLENDNLLELGILNVESSNYEDVVYVSTQEDETDDDFISYDPTYSE